MSSVYNDKIYLTPQEILEHDFKIDARGYRPQEVDKYLDMVIRDYAEFNNIIKTQNKEIDDLNNDIYTLKSEIRRLESELQTAQDEIKNKPSNVTNIEHFRRISQLEKAVFGKDE